MQPCKPKSSVGQQFSGARGAFLNWRRRSNEGRLSIRSPFLHLVVMPTWSYSRYSASPSLGFVKLIARTTRHADVRLGRIVLPDLLEHLWFLLSSFNLDADCVEYPHQYILRLWYLETSLTFIQRTGTVATLKLSTDSFRPLGTSSLLWCLFDWRLRVPPRRWPLVRLTVLLKCVDYLDRVLAGCCWKVLTKDPDDSLGVLRQAARF